RLRARQRCRRRGAAPRVLRDRAGRGTARRLRSAASDHARARPRHRRGRARGARATAPKARMAKRLDARVILVEGLPGAGKTTLAAGLAHALERRGVAARWLREEDPAHPVTPRALKRTRGEDGFALRCVDAIAPLRPRLVHLGSSAPRGFLRDRGGRARGPTWVERVAAYVAETPLARARGWQGRDGMLAFWSHYDALC